MSRIDELIEKLCPDGVEYKKLEEIVKEINIGINPRKFFKLNPIDATGFYVTVRELNGLQGVKQYDKTDKINDEAVKIINDRAHIEKGDILFSNTGTVGKLALVNETPNNWGVNEGIYIIKPLTDVILSKFLYYYLDSTHAYKDYSSKFTGSTLKHVTQKALLSLIVAVPPMEVQCEIVHVLDDFTLLSAELSAELKARQKQYDYYATKLFEKVGGEEIAMGQLANFVYGYTDKANESGDTRFIRITDINEQGILKNEDKKYIDMNAEAQKCLLKKGDLVMARTGATYGKTLYFDSDFPSVYASFLIKIIPDNTRLLNKYYWHYTKTPLYWNQAKKLVTTGGQPQFNSPALKQIKIPIPSVEEQQRIINILDRLDKLCNDIKEGLPAEIEARKKQYEFYRDKLLTFKEKVK